MTTKIKMKKGYPTSDGEMHEKHADAVKRQVEIDMKKITDDDTTVDTGNILMFISSNSEAVSDYIKYCCKVTEEKASPAPKKKSTVKK